MNFSAGRPTDSIFISRKLRYERLWPLDTLSLSSSTRENFAPFAQLFRRARARLLRCLIFNSPVRGQTTGVRGEGGLSGALLSTPGAPFCPPSYLSFSLARSPFLGGNPSRRSAAPAFFPSINRNSLGDPTDVSVVIRTGISLDC